MSGTILTIDEVWAEMHARDTHRPPDEVREAVARGLDLAEERGGASLGTIARARRLADGEPQSRETVRRIASYHSDLSKAGERDEVAWLLHGGEAGRAWTASLLQKAEKSEEEAPKKRTTKDDRPVPPQNHRELRRRIGLLLGAYGAEGAPFDAFAEYVQRHGFRAVARALRDLGADHTGGRVRAGSPRPATVQVRKAMPDSKPVSRPIAAPRWRPFRFRGVAA